MSIHDRLEEALDLLENLTADVEARERERTAHTHTHRAGDDTKRSGKKRKREADITHEDFDKRLFKLVQGARSGGGMPRGDQYRLLHTPKIQPPPGAHTASRYQEPAFITSQIVIKLFWGVFCLGMLT